MPPNTIRAGTARVGGSSTPEDARWMAMALGLARRALGRVAPNPAVAALIVRDGRLLARGVTARGGRPHAEAIAISSARARGAGDELRGATAYVTLEPCAHHGLTPPCADALAAAGIVRVVSTLEDPDPRVAGRGFTRMREAGVDVVTGVLADEARRVNEGFLARIELGRPHLVLKLATTLDGRIATASGESRWITGPAARRRVHALRARSDAVMIGAGTLRADDPMLDVRDFGAKPPAPARVVISTDLALPMDARIVRAMREDEGGAVWALHGPDAPQEARQGLRDAGLRLIEVPASSDGRVDPSAALKALADAGVTRVLCEGGGQLAASLLKAGLVDELWLFTAGRAIGAEGTPTLGPLGLDKLANAPLLEFERLERVGADTLSVWRQPV